MENGFFCQKSHFSRHLLKYIYLFSCLLFFLKTCSHFGDIMRRFSIFFLNFLCPFQNAVKIAGWTVPSQWLNHGFFFGVSRIKQILMYLEMIFVKNKEQTMRQLLFKFDSLPTESAEICLFHERWIKTFHTQPFGKLCIKYVLVFQKIELVQFCNKYLVGPSQKSSFCHSENRK